MQGVILAAGRGTRMGNTEVPKCLLKIGNITLIDHQLSCLKKLGINDVLVVTGFHHDMIRDHLGSGVEYIFNENFEQAELIAELAIKDKLVACANIFPESHSMSPFSTSD